MISARSTQTAGGLPSTTVNDMDVEAERDPLVTSALNGKQNWQLRTEDRIDTQTLRARLIASENVRKLISYPESSGSLAKIVQNLDSLMDILENDFLVSFLEVRNT